MKTRIFNLTILLLNILGYATMEHPILKNILLTGRWHITPQYICTTAPGAMLQFKANTKEVTFDIEGQGKFRLDIDNTISYFETEKREIKKIIIEDSSKVHLFRLIKISESNPGKIKIHNITLSSSGNFEKPPQKSSRKIEFIGDSFTVGYGNLAENSDDGTPFDKTDVSRSYAFLIADGYKADFQINAISGRGLIYNYEGIVPEWPLEKFYDYTLFGNTQQGDRDLWNFELFHPQVVVIFIGINDFQGNPPHADIGEFKKSYHRLLSKLRNLHNDVKFLLLSTKIWPDDSLTPVIEQIYKEETALGHKDLEYKVVFTENKALHGHPTLHSQRELAQSLRYTIGKLGGFLGR